MRLTTIRKRDNGCREELTPGKKKTAINVYTEIKWYSENEEKRKQTITENEAEEVARI